MDEQLRHLEKLAKEGDWVAKRRWLQLQASVGYCPPADEISINKFARWLLSPQFAVEARWCSKQEAPYIGVYISRRSNTGWEIQRHLKIHDLKIDLQFSPNELISHLETAVRFRILEAIDRVQL